MHRETSQPADSSDSARAATGERFVRIPVPAQVGDMRFTPDGLRLVVGLVNGRMVILDGGVEP